MSVPPSQGQFDAVSRQTDPLLFDDMGISKEMAMLLGSYYWMCEKTFGAELAKGETALSMPPECSHETDATDACRSENEYCGGSSSSPIRALFTPLPSVKATARCLEGCEGVSAPTAVVSMKTNSGAALKIVFRRDAKGLPIMEL